ncbi:MAG: LolA-like putative outer membrane lipoprotein chaperone [Bacteroidales bacterium]|nr:LolA-like putative outer membrane lipoprotein chaperone [Bacteroidales bacterium]
MNFFKIIAFLLIIPFCNTFSQQDPKAVQILDKARENFERSGSVSADFALTITEKNKVVNNQSGNIKLKASKFKISTEAAEIWFDGKSQWILPAGADEVSLTAPSLSEIEAINPIAMFQIYNKGYKCKFVSSKIIGGKTVDLVELIPKNAKQDISKITLNIDQKFSILLSIFIKNKNGTEQKVIITNYKTGLNYTDAFFVFNPKQYPTVEVVDLR